jgi:hypothetical protein
VSTEAGAPQSFDAREAIGQSWEAAKMGAVAGGAQALTVPTVTGAARPTRRRG